MEEHEDFRDAMMNVAAAQLGKDAEVIGVLKDRIRYLGTTQVG